MNAIDLTERRIAHFAHVAGARPWEFDWPTANRGTIANMLDICGAVVLRRCFDPGDIRDLECDIDYLYRALGRLHIHPPDMKAWDMSRMCTYLFGLRHYLLIAKLFRGLYREDPNTGTRRVGPPDELGCQAPLGPHVDAAVHPWYRTINLWVPFQTCDGHDRPSLGVVLAHEDEVKRFLGFSGRVGQGNGVPGEWNFKAFSPYAKRLWEGREGTFDEMCRYWKMVAEWDRPTREHNRIITPAFRVGDVVLMTNWTLHWSHVAPDVREPTRGNVELRFRA